MARKISVQVDMWVAEDGLTFSVERQCLEYEQKKKDYDIAKKFHTMRLGANTTILPNVGGDWILIRNEEELSYFNRQEYVKRSGIIYTVGNRKLELGDWVTTLKRADEDGESYDIGLITLEYVLVEVKKFAEKAEELTVEGKY